MFRIEGIAKTPGIAIAVAAVIDVIRGVNSVDPEILEKGMGSLRSQIASTDYPDIIIACDSLAVGLSTQLPGLSTAGIAAESDTDAPSLLSSVPCVIGISDLLTCVGKGDLIIIDGNEGVVYVDPDSQTLTHSVFDPAGFDKGLIDITLATAASAGFRTGDYEIPWVSTGITTSGPELLENFEVSHVLLMGGEWEDAIPEISRVSVALHGKSADRVMVYLGDRLDLIPLAVESGFRCISVNAGLARGAKEQIKSLG
jgi:hypothetical protein